MSTEHKLTRAQADVLKSVEKVGFAEWFFSNKHGEVCRVGDNHINLRTAESLSRHHFWKLKFASDDLTQYYEITERGKQALEAYRTQENGTP